MVEIFTYTVFSLVFTTSFQLTQPKEAGLNAIILYYNEKDTEQLSVTFVLFSKEAQESMKMSDSELINYTKTTFLGTSKPANSKKERSIINKKSEGEILSTKIPVASDIEIHLITLKNGNKICTAFKSKTEMNVEVRETIISEILSSLKEK